jgi:hypothetical protein
MLSLHYASTVQFQVQKQWCKLALAEGLQMCVQNMCLLAFFNKREELYARSLQSSKFLLAAGTYCLSFFVLPRSAVTAGSAVSCSSCSSACSCSTSACTHRQQVLPQEVWTHPTARKQQKGACCMKVLMTHRLNKTMYPLYVGLAVRRLGNVLRLAEVHSGWHAFKSSLQQASVEHRRQSTSSWQFQQASSCDDMIPAW